MNGGNGKFSCVGSEESFSCKQQEDMNCFPQAHMTCVHCTSVDLVHASCRTHPLVTLLCTCYPRMYTKLEPSRLHSASSASCSTGHLPLPPMFICFTRHAGSAGQALHDISHANSHLWNVRSIESIWRIKTSHHHFSHRSHENSTAFPVLLYWQVCDKHTLPSIVTRVATGIHRCL